MTNRCEQCTYYHPVSPVSAGAGWCHCDAMQVASLAFGSGAARLMFKDGAIVSSVPIVQGPVPDIKGR